MQESRMQHNAIRAQKRANLNDVQIARCGAQCRLQGNAPTSKAGEAGSGEGCSMKTRILNAISTPKAYPEIEREIYPKGRPNTWEGLFELPLALEGLKREGKVHYRKASSVKLGDAETSTTGMTWPLCCSSPIPPKFKAPTVKALRPYLLRSPA